MNEMAINVGQNRELAIETLYLKSCDQDGRAQISGLQTACLHKYVSTSEKKI